ncbi:phospho-N-acetylmuramoyl-pentapeptide-transferase [candidate division WOR-1 bacterium RIFOXYA12_FULL_52_29]|uniref:Phospho-N-acetylmuramoyl-pentapeptide-transferase n=1 Tax=candidate division WOR-1 bacterium RIFOXYC12_FULL_54_18 TaxID=1802584 RepID=A0A1F4T5F2_UNCSA|nr:MAG: phospho-N-acetylmuramoyl-pentapeptide-transferase [candidate division WOR-1 bacterium RIFOXYA2_FULL_51_19]OGC17353.1 MAG: phospho-N-acetylmuramoyl-pentapeptide-transferase [candidate division WOR-1 bacterium RIFOXYA12_FULL_52_29]OGC26212.1 MAG: phospho-N-acetylmuramoyl-pentapeptide-transferase [candidate division WOR-1 bacterium RIFOXYB2_FULL_45_9]OGC27770.1 MAG: phospho-N-acetylmuramoyl-pentapeptide-transferase [candidate division WOR-1 bacterium RIFOXYC12_FULL_54_18]OGC29941.1 MAG: ph
MISQIVLFFTAALISLLITYPVIAGSRFFKTRQYIRAEGPQSHLNKAGTPIMGGVGFGLAILIMVLIFVNVEMDFRYAAILLLMFAFAGIGLFDDLTKTIKKQNLGLNFWQKIFLQSAFAALFSFFLVSIGYHQQTGWLNYIYFGEPLLYMLGSTFIIVGAANATNLTDGLNGLLAGTGGLAFLFFAVIAHRLQMIDAMSVCLIAAGSVLAFLFYNFPKAQIFMGDTGSLALGALLAGIAVLLHQELRLIVIGGVFVLEALSVIVQVACYKLFKRRLFRMSPLHHHFELLGFKEVPVVLGFWSLGLIFGVAGVLLW